MKINLTSIAKRIAEIDNSGKRDLSIVQIRECLAALGIFLRTLTITDALRVCIAIIERAGKKSKNPK